jgi:hypothetical protein
MEQGYSFSLKAKDCISIIPVNALFLSIYILLLIVLLDDLLFLCMWLGVLGSVEHQIDRHSRNFLYLCIPCSSPSLSLSRVAGFVFFLHISPTTLLYQVSISSVVSISSIGDLVAIEIAPLPSVLQLFSNNSFLCE